MNSTIKTNSVNDLQTERIHPFKNNLRKICFNIPTNTKPISVTGTQCTLNCAHCGGHYLKHMLDIDTLDLNNFQYSSVLISGGCELDGSVNILPKLSCLNKLKEHNIKINMHTGLIEPNTILQLKDYIDAVSFDFVVDDTTIQTVYNLNVSKQKYIETYTFLKQHVKVVPHICIGLNNGNVYNEFESLSILKTLGASAIVFLVFIPTPNTKFANGSPPKLFKIQEVFEKAKKLFPNTPLHLGCMRPRGEYGQEVEKMALFSEFTKIVNPTKNTIKLAKELCFEIYYGKECCIL